MKSIYIIIGALLIGFSYLGNSAIIASAQETETNVRTNLKYIEGSPNDTHVVYTYDKYPYGKPQTDEVARGSGNREYGCRRLREKLPNFSGVSFF